MYYRYEVQVNGIWYGICNALSEFGRLGGKLEECGLYEPNIEWEEPSKCWFTQKGKTACESVIKEITSEITVPTRCLVRKNLSEIIFKDEMQVVCKAKQSPVCEEDVPYKMYTKKLHVYTEDWETEERTYLFTEVSGSRYKFETLCEGYSSYMKVNGKMEDVYLNTSYYECVPYMFCDYDGEWFNAEEYIIDAEQIPELKRKLSKMYDDMKVALINGNASQKDMSKIKAFLLNRQKGDN